MVSWVGHRSWRQDPQGCWKQACGSWPASKLVTKCCHKNSCGLPHPISGHGRDQPESGHVDRRGQEVGPGTWLLTTQDPCQQILSPETLGKPGD